MNSAAAFEKIRAAFARMDTLYGRPVFDEWAIVEVHAGGANVLGYEGPRSESFHQDVRKDVLPLQQAAERELREPGCFGFAREAGGSAIDAYVVLAKDVYLLCNATTASMAEVTEAPEWRKAQVAFLELAEVFRLNPLRTAVDTAISTPVR